MYSVDADLAGCAVRLVTDRDRDVLTDMRKRATGVTSYVADPPNLNLVAYRIQGPVPFAASPRVRVLAI